MSTTNNIIAIGRSRYLYDGIKYLVSKGFVCKAIVTEEAYEEYDIKHTDFELLAAETGALFFMMKSLNNDELIQIVREKQDPCGNQRKTGSIPFQKTSSISLNVVY
ncbi:MAG: hypothetical protein WDM78_19040 [Puia sp.]